LKHVARALAHGARGSKQARVAGRAAERPGIAVVNLAQKHASAPLVVARGRGSDAPDLRRMELDIRQTSHVPRDRVELD
jgi:hypothetical protein